MKRKLRYWLSYGLRLRPDDSWHGVLKLCSSASETLVERGRRLVAKIVRLSIFFPPHGRVGSAYRIALCALPTAQHTQVLIILFYARNCTL